MADLESEGGGGGEPLNFLTWGVRKIKEKCV